MRFPNYHTHTHYCDGTSLAEEYIKAAVKSGMPALGFSGHAPVPIKSWWNMDSLKYRKYRTEIQELKKKYQGTIDIYWGVEADFIDDIIEPDDFRRDNPDYIIGGIHFLPIDDTEDNWDFISKAKYFEQGFERYFNNDAEKLVKHYYTQMNKMLESNNPDIIAHIDQVNKFNWGDFYFSEEAAFYTKAVDETLDMVKQNGAIVEINTRIAYRKLSEQFNPSPSILKKMKALNIPIVFSADAHKPEQVNMMLNDAAEMAMAAGYEEYYAFNGKKFRPKSLKPKAKKA